jgi:hypothetical protein
LAIDHRRVADWPRSIVRGSAVKLLMCAADGVGGGGSVTFAAGGGGGGAGAGAFFLQPATDKNSIVANTAALSVLVFIRILIRFLLENFP